MATASFEIINGLLFITGSLDRGSDNEFQQALEKYAEVSDPQQRAVDMTHVRWLAPTGAKVLISAAQDTQEKGGKLRVLASRHVMQTLNLLGAKTWLQIESYLTPTVKPADGAAPSPAADESQVDAQAVGAAPTAPKTGAVEEPKPSPAPATAVPDPAKQALPASSASASGMMSAVSRGMALAGPAEQLCGGAYLLRVLCPNRRYSFHFQGGEEITGILRERVGGSWILLETHGTRKMINLDVVQYCEIL
jgi:anti-anti-sigma factor